MKKRSILKELASMLREAGDATSKDAYEGGSLDEQVDKFLVDYEKDAKTLKKESFDVRSATRLMLEADEEEDEKKEDVGTTELDPVVFASSVARLIMNYDSLLDVKDALAKRAFNFVLKTHDLSTARQVLDALRRNYDIEIDKTQFDRDTDIVAPPAARSGGAGGT
jgi:hypothetical protein